MKNWLTNLFRKEERLDSPVDLSPLKCDVHSHFIPGIDDGAPNMEASLMLISGIEAFGYKKIITTPHVMGDYYRNSSETILAGRDEVRKALTEHGSSIDFHAAAEYYLDPEFLELINKKDILTFGKNYVLFELPFISEPQQLNRAIFDLQLAGYKPILAHPERYSYYHMEFERYEELAEKGVLLQLNINSLTGHYSPEVKKIAERLIDSGLISVLGSDCHHPGHLQLMDNALIQPALQKLLASGKLINHEL